MAIFDARNPPRTADVVAVLDGQTGRQVFGSARPMKATVSESAKLLAHPLEDGGNIVDHRIILPIGLSLAMILDANTYRETYQEIRQIFRESRRLSVQTKTATYTNLYLQNIPHDEDPALFDTATIVLEFIETLIAQVQIQALPPAAVASANDASTLERGEQTTTDGGSRGSALFRFASGT